MQNKDYVDKVEQFSPSLVNERIEHLKKLFPECFTEAKIDFLKLRIEIFTDNRQQVDDRWTYDKDCI